MSDKHKCEYCGKQMRDSYTYERHKNMVNPCIKLTKDNMYELFNNRKLLKDKDQMIVEMQDKFLELHNENEALKLENRDLKTKFDLINEIKDALINKPNTNTNKTINNNIIVKNPKPFGKECFDIKKLDIKRHLLNGQQGLATFVYENILIDKLRKITNYVCADPARRIYKMLCDDFYWKKDINSHYLSIILSEIFRNENCDVWNRYMQYMDEHESDMDALTRMEWNNKISQILVDIKSRDPKFLKKLMEELVAKIYKEKHELNNIKFEKEYGYKIGTSAEYSEEESSEEERSDYESNNRLEHTNNNSEYINDNNPKYINDDNPKYINDDDPKYINDNNSGYVNTKNNILKFIDIID